MADTPNITIVPRNRAQRTKLTLADIGQPAIVKGATPDMIAAKNAEFGITGVNNKLILGKFIGIASGFVERTSPDKTEKFPGLKGQFRVIPADPKLEELESGVCFFPDAYHNMIADPLKAAIDGDPARNIPGDPHANSRFAFQVAAIPAKNPAGYSWEFTPLMQPDRISPLDDLMSGIQQLAAPAANKQIEAKAARK